MNTEHKKIEITKEEWLQFLSAASFALSETIDRARGRPDDQAMFKMAHQLVPRLIESVPIALRDAEQLPRLRLKRKNQRTAYRNLQAAYERVRGWWMEAAAVHQVAHGSCSFTADLSYDGVPRQTSENGTLVFDPNADQPKNAA